MTFSTSRSSSHVNQITHTHTHTHTDNYQTYHPLALRHLSLDNSNLHHYYSLRQAHHVMACHSTPGNQQPKFGRTVRKNTGTKLKWPHEMQSSTYPPGLSSHSSFSFIVEQLPQSFLCCQSLPSQNPSNLASVYSVPALHFILPSIAFLLYGTHPSLHVSKPQYFWSTLLTCSLSILFQPFYAPLHS